MAYARNRASSDAQSRHFAPYRGSK